MTMLFKRVLTAVTGIAIFTLFIYWGSLPFYIFISVITAITIYEFNKLIPENLRINYLFVLILTLFIPFFHYFYSFPSELITFIIFIILISYLLIKRNCENIGQTLGFYIFGFFYIGGGFTYFLYLRNYPNDFIIKFGSLWLVLLATWATDTGAYFFGKYLGKKKLAPEISPNKTVGGALGGIFLTIIVVNVLVFIGGYFSYVWVFYALIISLLSVVGDLFESAMKRNAGLKDTGNIMPGHGGLLDRFDSLLLTVPFTYFFLLLFVW